MRAPIPDSKEELGTEVARLRMTLTLMEREVLQANARADASDARAHASDAHCTIMKRALSEARTELLSKQKSKDCRTVKTSACYVAHEMIKELHASQSQEKAMRAREAAEKEAQKAQQEAAHQTRIWEETRTFPPS